MTDTQDETSIGDDEELARAIERRLSELWKRPVAVRELVRLSGGASRETYSFVADGRPLVLRRDPAGDLREGGMPREAAVIRAADRVGVPVATVVDSAGADSTLGAGYLIADWVEGDTRPQTLLRANPYADMHDELLREIGQAFARIHRIPVDGLDLEPPGDPVAGLRNWYDTLAEPLPVLEAALIWLDANRPADRAAAVVHGDLRNGNLMVSESGLAAVLDWELVHLGDPLEDLGWFCVPCWRFGGAGEAGGFGSLDVLLDGYEQEAGWRPDPAEVRWWQAYGIARWAIGCREMAGWHLSGQSPSIELAAIGRRVAEQEYDLLRAIGVADAEDYSELAESSGALTGRPTSEDLVDAVAGFVRDDLLPGAEGRTAFLTKVALNVLACLAREARFGAAMETRLQNGLTRAGFRDNTELSHALRAGSAHSHDPSVAAVLWSSTRDKLRLWNPGYGD